MVLLAIQTIGTAPPPLGLSPSVKGGFAVDSTQYSQLLQKTNEQLSYTLGAQGTIVSWLSLAVGVLSLLFTIGSIGAAILLYFQSRDAKRERAKLVKDSEEQVREASKRVREAERLVRTAADQTQVLLASARTQLVSLEESLTAKIVLRSQELAGASGGVSEELMHQRRDLEELRATVRGMYDATGALVAKDFVLGEMPSVIKRLIEGDEQPDGAGASSAASTPAV